MHPFTIPSIITAIFPPVDHITSPSHAPSIHQPISTIHQIESIIKRKITTRDDRALFDKVVKLSKRDINTSLHGYVDAIVVYSTPEVDSAEEEFDLEDEPLKEMYQSGISTTRP